MVSIVCSIALMLAGPFALHAQDVHFQASIENPLSGYFLVVGPEGEVLDSMLLDAAGNCEGTFRVEPGTYRFTDGNEYFTAYLEPGYDLHLTLNTDSFDETVHFKGVGSNVNNYLAASYLFDEQLEEQLPTSVLFTLDEGDFLAKLDSLDAARELLITGFELDPEFAQHHRLEAEWNRKVQLHVYPRYHAYFTKADSAMVSESFPDPMEDLDLKRPDLLKFDGYSTLVNAWVEKQVQESMKATEGLDYWLVRAQKAISLETPEVREVVLQNGATYGFRISGEQEKLYRLYMDHSTDAAFKERISTAYSKLKKIAEGNPSPLFRLLSANGDSVWLADLKGKLVYIDVWATWCGPCIREIPHLKELEEAYHGKDIHFVSIAGSSEYPTWTKMVTDMELGGIQLYAPDGEAFMKDYQIVAYPTFILLDRELHIVDANAKRPSDPELRTQLDGLLNQ